MVSSFLEDTRTFPGVSYKFSLLGALSFFLWGKLLVGVRLALSVFFVIKSSLSWAVRHTLILPPLYGADCVWTVTSVPLMSVFWLHCIQ